ncbi:beta-glucosidase [Paratractidigestivibacter sp.]|uniref:beta-glucosidase n=1 Tax=Paratractidigestivibacter sp. TaxID=2847316 RepID=UPI002AC97E71|nr:glycoside hydrolase family 3 C-terminal domain-containing protein [Paratractidigestivibacter sp.]
MKLNMTRRGFFFSVASAAVMAGLAGCNAGGGASGGSSSKPAEGTEYFKSGYEYTEDGEKKLLADEQQLYTDIVTGGMSLLRNEGNALPLSKDDGKVSIFGCAGPAYLGGTTTDDPTADPSDSLNATLKTAGFTVDDDCWSFYKNGNAPVAGASVNENPWSDVKSQGFYGKLSGVALVVLGRRGQEGGDEVVDETTDYLALSAEEKDMLSGIAEMRRAGTFTKFVVIMTCTNTISWEDGAWSDAIDSILWIGKIGAEGVAGVVQVLDGEVNPSGRIPDAIYKNNRATPQMANFGAIDADLSHLSVGKDDEVQEQSDYWKPSSDKGSHWRRNIVYAEGIYLGYRYYETRYEDKVMGVSGVGDFDYASYIAYPFGTGLSYTTFEYSDFSGSEADDKFELSVKVTNTGKVAGRTPVLVYVQSPYTDYDRENGIEKAAIELVGFQKTGSIEPGASEDVKVSVPKKELRTYDSNKARTYILDAGEYYFTVAGSSHEAINNVLAAKGLTAANGMTADGDPSLVFTWSNNSFNDKLFSTSSVTGNDITNLFDDVDPNKNETMKALNSITWMSRSNWEGTFPKEAIHLVYTDEVADMAKPISYQAGSGDASSVAKHEFGKESDLKLVDMLGKDYDDADWDKLVSKLTYEEMVAFINDTEGKCEAVGKPTTGASNGSFGLETTFVASGIKGLSWPTPETRAATFDRDLYERAGRYVVENMLHASTAETKTTSLYGWACNMHRSPYSGRNFEYYSEDPYLSGQACAVETKGVVDNGGLVYTKHFAGNDQEEYRHGVPSWMNEQALREIYLAPFEEAVVEGKANGIMTGFHRLGMHWTGESKSLLIDYLEDELGYRGITLTDQYETDYMDGVDGVLNGTHAWLGGERYKSSYKVLMQDDYSADPVIQDAVYNATKRVLYNFANSLSINGLSSNYEFGTEYGIGGKKEVCEAHASDWKPTPACFYEDKTYFACGRIFANVTIYKGTWDYSDDKGLTLTAEDGTAVEVTETAGGVLSWRLGSDDGGFFSAAIDNRMSKHDFVVAMNDAMGTKYTVPAETTYELTYAAGTDDATGSDPAGATLKFGDTFTLPENPYQSAKQEFIGWDVNGETMQPGDVVTANDYLDYPVKGVWQPKTLATAKTQDGFKFSYSQKETVPMVLYIEGNKVRLNHINGVTSTGTWKAEVNGSALSLSILNEAGQPVQITTDEQGRLIVEKEGFYYDWGRPDLGWGSGVFRTSFKHKLDPQALLDKYSKEFGASCTSVTPVSGTATFAETPDESAPALSYTI